MTVNRGSESTEKQAQDVSEFEAAALHSETGLISEFWYFLKNSKKWWLLPIVVVLLIFSGLMLMSGTAVAPFIYTLF